MNTQEQILSQLIITRDGSMDSEYYAAQRTEELREAFRELGRRSLHVALRTPLVVGQGLVWLVCHENQNG